MDCLVTFLSDHGHTIFVLLFLAIVLIVLDIHYIGVSAILAYGHNVASPREKVLDTLLVGAIRSNCFGSEPMRYLYKGTGAFDSIVAVTTRHLQIGRRLLSYHYQVDLDDIDKVDFRSGGTHIISVYVARKGGRCEIHIEIPVWSRRVDRVTRHFVNTLIGRIDNQ